MNERKNIQDTRQGGMAAGGTSAATPQLLFDFLGDVIYDAKNARLDVSALDKEYRALGEGLVCLARMILEAKDFAGALARGDLKTPVPGRDNEIASPLKALHASLRHMTWQTQQVAKGDYKQRIAFLGEFSEAFNTMVEQLDARQKALEKEIEASREKTRALQAAGSLVAKLTEKIPQVIVVLSEDTERMLYSNQAAQAAMEKDPQLLPNLRQAACRMDKDTCEVTTQVEEEDRYYEVQSYSLQWEEQNAMAYVVEDASDRHAHVRRLEKLANWDELTRLNNRHFGMETLREWLGEGRAFTLCFLDLDNLKCVNDTFGHVEGDRYIRRAADLLRTFQDGAVACRVGGDEFMVLVPNAKGDAMDATLEVMCQGFKQAEENQVCGTSISYGVVEVEPGCSLSASTVLSIADERMYEHKRKNKKQRESVPPPKNA